MKTDEEPLALLGDIYLGCLVGYKNTLLAGLAKDIEYGDTTICDSTLGIDIPLLLVENHLIYTLVFSRELLVGTVDILETCSHTNNLDLANTVIFDKEHIANLPLMSLDKISA